MAEGKCSQSRYAFTLLDFVISGKNLDIRCRRQVAGTGAKPMSASTQANASRSPFLILLCGCMIAMATFGPRATMGLFTTPITVERGFSLELFSFALAIQNLLWGVGQPFAGGLADRFGVTKVLAAGLVLYAAGLAIMAYTADPLVFNLSAGVLIGFGLSGCSFNLVLSAFGKLMPPEWRGTAIGAGSAAGSFGQFIFAPTSSLLIRTAGWSNTLVIFAVLMLLCVPLVLPLWTPRNTATPQASMAGGNDQTLRQAVAEAFGHRSYLLLVAGFFVCGFHLAFVTVHLPKFLVEQGLTLEVGGWTLALIGLFNIVGSLSSGFLGNRIPKRWLLSSIYIGRAVAIALFVSFPVTNVSALLFGAALGLLWLSTIPPTSGLIAIMFGTRWLATLYGIAFFSHQVGSFTGLVIAAWTRETYGSYAVIWWLGVLLGVAAAIVNMPIKEGPVSRIALAPAE